MRKRAAAWVGLLLWMAALPALGQAVAVTVRFDTNRIAVGGTTLLRVYGQVAPALQQDADRIFAWYLDVLNSNQLVAAANYSALLKPTSDNDPLISSTGANQGANRVGIYDTFLGLPGAGVNTAVELMRIPVRGLAAGRARFQVRAGTTVDGLSSDFLVAPLNDGTGWTGGDYSAAFADLDVGGGVCSPSLSFTPLSASAGAG